MNRGYMKSYVAWAGHQQLEIQTHTWNEACARARRQHDIAHTTPAAGRKQHLVEAVGRSFLSINERACARSSERARQSTYTITTTAR